MNSRRRIRGLLDRAFDGTLDADGWLELEAAGRRDGRVAAEFQRDRKLVEALEHLADPEAEAFDVEAFAAAVEARIANSPSERASGSAARRRPWLLALPVLAAAAAVAFVLLRGDAPSESAPRNSGNGGGGARSNDALADAHADQHGDAVAPAELDNEWEAARPLRGGAVLVAQEAPPVDAARQSQALDTLGELLARTVLPRSDEPAALRAWFVEVRTSFAALEGSQWPFESLVRRRVRAASGDEAAVGLCLLLACGDPTADALVRDRIGSGAADQLDLLRALSASGAGTLLADVALGAGSDLASGDRDFLTGALERSERLAAAFERALLAGPWNRLHPELLRSFAETRPGLVARLVDSAFADRTRRLGLAALRGDERASAAVLQRTAAATRRSEREAAIEAIGLVGATDGAGFLASRCRSGDDTALGALLDVPGEFALASFVELSGKAAPSRRTALWERAALLRGDELAVFAKELPAGHASVAGLIEGLTLTGAPAAAPALLALAARSDLRSAERSTCLEAAAEVADALDLDALQRAADAAPDDAHVQATCLLIVWNNGGRASAETWCSARFSDVRPLDALERSSSSPAAVRARLRLHLAQLIEARLRA